MIRSRIKGLFIFTSLIVSVWIGDGYIFGDKPSIDLESITFNHNHIINAGPDGLGYDDAIDIRMNYTDPVRVPEWKKGRENQYPAAYKINRCITVEATFSKTSTELTSVEIWAETSTRDGLGNLKKETVFFENGTAKPVYFKMYGTTPKKVTKFKQEWEWYYRSTNGTNSPKVKIGISKNLVYIIVSDPQSPWENDDETVPWADVLDYSCKWAEGATTQICAATKITRSLYDELGGSYQRFPRYTHNKHASFNLSGFLRSIPSYYGIEEVNCFDMAKALIFFSNAIGCKLSYKVYKPFGDTLNCIKPIGLPRKCTEYFEMHAIARLGDKIFDATIKAYCCDWEEWLVNTEWERYKEMVIKRGNALDILGRHRLTIRNENDIIFLGPFQNRAADNNIIPGIKIDSASFKGIAENMIIREENCQLEKVEENQYSSITRKVWDAENGTMDITMEVHPSLDARMKYVSFQDTELSWESMPIKSFDSFNRNLDNIPKGQYNGYKFSKHNIHFRIKLYGEFAEKMPEIINKFEYQLSTKKIENDYSKLQGIPEILFKSEKQKMKKGERVRLLLDVKNTIGGKLHYFWRTYKGHIEQDEKGDFFYRGVTVGDHHIKIIVVNEIGLIRMKTIKIEVVGR